MIAGKIILFIAVISALSAGSLVLFHAVMNPAFVVFLSVLFLVSLIAVINMIIFTGKAAAFRILLMVFTIIVSVCVILWIFCILFQKPEAEEISGTTLEIDDTDEKAMSGTSGNAEDHVVHEMTESVPPEENVKIGNVTGENVSSDTGHENVKTSEDPDYDAIISVENGSDVSDKAEAETSAESSLLDDSSHAEQTAVEDGPAAYEAVSNDTGFPDAFEESVEEYEDGEGKSVPVPDKPSILSVNVMEDSEVVYYQPPRWEDDDFWSTFYIAGSEDLVLADGLYYMTLVINNESVGTIETLIENGEASISSEAFRSYIEGNVIDEVMALVFADESLSYIPLSYLNEISVAAKMDSDNYIIDITFSATDMPVQIISIRSTSGIPVARRPITGATTIDPAVFYLISRYSLSSSLNISEHDKIMDSLSLTLSSYNTLRLFDVYGSFSYYLSYDRYRGFDARFGTYSFYSDFPQDMIRLSWGNVGTDLLSPDGTALGIGFDKSLSYALPGTRGKSHIERLLVIEKESEVTIYNEGREIFRRTLQPGSYRLQDFVLYTGANRIRIIVDPLDGSPSEEFDISLNYTSSLLAPGEVYYGANLASGRRLVSDSQSKREGALRIPLPGDESLEYDLRNLTLSGYIHAGLTTSLSMNLALAVQNKVNDTRAFNPAMAAALELTHANFLGTTRYSFRTTEITENGDFILPDIYARVGHQIYFDSPVLSSLSLAATYSGDTEDNNLSGSLSLSGRLGFLSWGLSGYISSDLNSADRISWNTSGSLSATLGRHMSVSASMNVSGIGDSVPSISGRVSASLRFGPVSSSTSWSPDYSYMNVNAYSGRHGFSARIDTTDFTEFDKYGLSADYSYSGDYLSGSFSVDTEDSFNRTRLSLSLSTSTLFADGLFTMASSIPSNFLLIRQKGILKDNELSLGIAGSSASITPDRVLGTYMYSGLSSTSNTSLSIYSTAEDSFSASEVFDITIPATQRRGFVLRLEADVSYTVSALVYADGMLWANGSSPLYRVSEDEEGNEVLEATDLYLFTDAEGRFTVSGLESGEYAFDVPSGSSWYSYRFTVSENPEDSALIHLYETFTMDDTVPQSPYSASGHYSYTGSLTSEDFWLMLYPEMREAV